MPVTAPMTTTDPVFKHRFFIYGTLKRGQPNFVHFEDPLKGKVRYVGNAQLKVALPLIVCTRWNLPFLLDAPGKGARVVGEIFEVDDAMLAFMDEFEGHPEVYQREKVSVIPQTSTGGVTQCQTESVTECWTYVLKNFPSRLIEKPALEKYDAYEDRQRTYCPDDDLCGPDNIHEALLADCC